MKSRRALLVALAFAAAALVPGSSLAVDDLHQHLEKPDRDVRTGTVQPTAAQRAAAESLGAFVTWNRFGTPGTLVKYGGFLAEGIAAESAGDAARTWLQANKALYRLNSLDGLELVTEFRMPDSSGWMAHFRQTFGGIPAGAGDGFITLGVVGTPHAGWKIAHVSASAAADSGLAAQPVLTGEQAWVIAAQSLGKSFSVAQLSNPRLEGEWLKFEVPGVADVQQVRPVALPTARGAARPAFESIVFMTSGFDHPTAYAVFVDAATGDVLVRHSMIDYAAPKWQVFPAYPTPPASASYPWNVSSTDIRETWCWTPVAGCTRTVETASSPYPWDVVPKAAESSSLTTIGNNAITFEAWSNNTAAAHMPKNADRNFSFPWTNVWNTSECSPTNFTPATGLDIDAAVLNLFAMHNRMHDFAYALGFQEKTWNGQQSNFQSGGAENDPVEGHAQAGGATNTRDNANMSTNTDGSRSVTNMYLWQPVRGSFYAPCVDGDYDMAVIGHEYTHMIENRMIGKGSRRSGHHAGAMGESNSDLVAMEYLNANGFVPVADENPYAVGAYATGNKTRGIRNFAMNQSPLNFSNMGYDLTGPQVHADGEIWSAVNFEIRKALIAKFNGKVPASNVELQRQCAAGLKSASECPGNRRWAQIMFDAYLLMPTAPSMLQSRDAYLAADMMRFGGANQATLWQAFAQRGFGEGAFATNGTSNSDTDPKPDFTSPLHEEGTITFTAVDATTKQPVTNARIYVGEFEARTSPIADTNPDTNATGAGANTLDDVASFVPGKYAFVVNAPGYGQNKFTRSIKAGDNVKLEIVLPENFASRSKGATPTGDGTRHFDLIDDNEATNWESVGTTSAAGRSVTIDLGTKRGIKYVQASAFLIPANPAQNRFTALRSFELWTCNATTGADCSNPASFTKSFASPPDAFPSDAPRPTGPSLAMRRWAIPTLVYATHVRFVVVANQCIGQPQFQGVQDDDPASTTDCRTGVESSLPNAPVAQDTTVRASELQLQGKGGLVVRVIG